MVVDRVGGGVAERNRDTVERVLICEWTQRARRTL